MIPTIQRQRVLADCQHIEQLCEDMYAETTQTQEMRDFITSRIRSSVAGAIYSLPTNEEENRVLTRMFQPYR